MKKSTRNLLKRLFAMALCIAMILGLFDGIPVGKRTISTSLEAEAAAWNDFGYDCVAYVKARVREKLGFTLHPAASKGANGYWYNASAFGDRTSSEPMANTLAVWNGCGCSSNNWCGHVAFVESVDGEWVRYGEGGYAGHYNEATRSKYAMSYYDAAGCLRQFLGYVYLNGANYNSNISYYAHTGTVTNITNTTATITGSVTASSNVTCSAEKIGFYIGTNPNYMDKKFEVAYNDDNMTANIASYYNLKYGTKYYYKVYAIVNGQEKEGNLLSFTTRADKPAIPTLKVTNNKTDIGLEASPTVNWNKVTNAKSYNLYLYNEAGKLVDSATGVTGTKHAFSAMKETGTYTAQVEAVNEVGSKGKSNSVTFRVHEDVTVKFLDADSFVDVGDDYTPEVLGEKKIHYGESVVAPSNPSHTGYTFAGWDGDYTDVTEDTVVKATYDINQYTVKYIDSTTSEELATKKVTYYQSAENIDYAVPTGYVKTGYDGWDKDYKCITGDTTLYTCVGWYNENFPIYATITSAVREYDAEVSDNEGYTIVVSLKNWDESTTKGRVVVALKTKEGKLLTSTESSAFSIKKSATKELEIFVPYDKAASIAEVYVVGQYKDAVPITTTASNNAILEIDQSMTYTNWSTEKPAEDVTDVQSRDEWRYQDKTTTTSYNTSLSGYTQSGSSWVQSGSGTIDYVSSFPSGFYTGNYYYSLYNKAPKTASETATNKTVVSTSTVGYLYWHWCRGTYTAGPINRTVSDCWESNFPTFHAHTSSALGYNSSSGAFQSNRGDVCKDSYWWLSNGCWSNSQLPIKRCSYTTYKKLFNYYKWSDFTDWSTNEVAATSNRNVESRTVYRYRDESIMVEDNSGEERTISGSLGTEFAGKEAALFIYKVDEASDYTNEYVAQTKLDDAGNYSFTFKLREEPSAKTGDMTVVLGVEGTSTAIYLDTIKAPKKEYTVKFFDYDGSLISEQTVEEGAAAELPDESTLQRTGYTFTKWSDTNVNITENKEIYAEYEINKYNVVFVDWQANSVSVEEFEYGAPLITPIAEEPEEGQLVEWGVMKDGEVQLVDNMTTVTDNMIVCTQYSTKTFDVQIKDYKGEVIDTQTVEYGKAVEIPELDDEDGKYIFLGWENQASGENETMTDTLITKNTLLCPRYVFSESAVAPIANVENGTYDEAQTVTLTSETENALIFYTLDGSEPTSYNGILYEEPITIDDTVILKACASKGGMNDSEVVEYQYQVNAENARSPWMLVADLPQEVKDNMDEYVVEAETGYRYKDVKTTTLLTEASALETAGWTYVEDETYSDYTEWLDEPLNDDGSYIGVECETQPVYDESSVYQYSHYVYTDGTATQYAAKEVEGFECTQESVTFESKLSVAGFTDSGAPYYVYDGQTWYNQEKVTGQVQTGTQYRYRYKVATYYRWTGYTIEKPSVSETRAYETADVYSYIRHKKYFVYVSTGVGVPSALIMEEGDKFDVTPYKEITGYTFGGVYTDDTYETEWDVDNDTITESMTLYIHHIPNKYTVTFAYADGTEIDTQKVEYMSAATTPEVEEVEGYRFIGWSSDEYLCVEKDVTVTAKFVDEDEYATVSLDADNEVVYKGKTIALTATISPASQSAQELTWSSDDESVATVDTEGRVTGISAGTATITVKVVETGEVASCKVEVKVNADDTLSLVKNAGLSVDDNGYLRGITVDNNTVADVMKEFENNNLICKNADGEELSDSDVLGTGSKVCVIKNGKVVDEIVIVMTGDLSGDGVINNRDVVLLSRALIDKEVPGDAQILAADSNGDGSVNNRDAVLISRTLVGKEILK